MKPLSDLIDKQSAIDAIEKWLVIAKHPCNESEYNCGEIDAYECALYEIKKLPSVVVAGNCMVCGKPIDDNHLFLCKDCQKKQSCGEDMRGDS